MDKLWVLFHMYGIFHVILCLGKLLLIDFDENSNNSSMPTMITMEEFNGITLDAVAVLSHDTKEKRKKRDRGLEAETTDSVAR